MTEVNKYNHSKIYKICSNKTDKIYIGSTTQILAKRLHEHLQKYKHYLKTNTKHTTSIEIIKLEDYYIVLIEECNYNNKQQLFKREGEIIKLNSNIVVNRMITGRTKKEYRVDNKEYLLEQQKQYNNNNKEKILEYQKQYNIDNKEKRAECDKQYRIDNKEKIKERKIKPFTCVCGAIIKTDYKSQHNKTNKHINYTNTIINTITI